MVLHGKGNATAAGVHIALDMRYARDYRCRNAPYVVLAFEYQS